MLNRRKCLCLERHFDRDALWKPISPMGPRGALPAKFLVLGGRAAFVEFGGSLSYRL